MRWASWAGRITTQWYIYIYMWECEDMRLWLSRADSPSMWPLVRNAHVRWFRPDTKNMMCDINRWVSETKLCCVIQWMSLESWDVWLLIDMLVLWIKYALLYKLTCIPCVYGGNQYMCCKYICLWLVYYWYMIDILSVYNCYIIGMCWIYIWYLWYICVVKWEA